MLSHQVGNEGKASFNPESCVLPCLECAFEFRGGVEKLSNIHKGKLAFSQNGMRCNLVRDVEPLMDASESLRGEKRNQY